MKLPKAIKKLKLWSRKRKKYTYYITDHPPPPSRPPPPLPPTFNYWHSWVPVPVPVQPSAPPLPPWFEFDHEQDQNPHFGPDSGIASSSQAEFSTQEEIAPDQTSEVSNDASYQQYMVPNPVYGTVPVLPAVKREKAAGFFGCFVSIGRHLISCLFPCFLVRE